MSHPKPEFKPETVNSFAMKLKQGTQDLHDHAESARDTFGLFMALSHEIVSLHIETV